MAKESEPSHEPVTYLVCEKPKSYMSNEELLVQIDRMGYLPYDDLPAWLKCEMQSRGVTFKPRPPTQQEMREAEPDAFQHRVNHNECNIDDFLQHFRGNRRIK